MNILEKIQGLLADFRARRADEQDLRSIGAWYDEAKRLILLGSLKNHDATKYVLEVFQSEVSRINLKLSREDSNALPDRLRDRFIDRRDLAQKYLDLFSGIETDLEKLEEEVDKNSA